jgi:Na+-driven multidrug efflux pump
MSIKRKIFYITLLLVLSFNFVNAQVGGELPSETLENPLKYDNVPELIEAIINIVVQIGVPVVGVMIIYSGFLFVSAQGNEEKLTKAKSAFLWTVIGAAIVLGAFVISRAIRATIDQLQAVNRPPIVLVLNDCHNFELVL